MVVSSSTMSILVGNVQASSDRNVLRWMFTIHLQTLCQPLPYDNFFTAVLKNTG